MFRAAVDSFLAQFGEAYTAPTVSSLVLPP
jgi:hypothetical protein